MGMVVGVLLFILEVAKVFLFFDHIWGKAVTNGIMD